MSAATPFSPGTRRLWVGTYPADGPGGVPSGEGVWRVDLDLATGTLTGWPAAPTPSPSFVALHPDGRRLYAVGEEPAGTVAVFAVTDGGDLEPRGRVTSAGEWPCHVLVHPSGRALYVTNYEDGSLAVLPLAPDGDLAPEVLAAGRPLQVFPAVGSGPVADRQAGPHAHSSLLLGDHLLVADLGTDELRRFHVGPDGLLEEAGVAHRFTPGTGPRHVAVGPGDHLYVVGELSATLHVLAWDAATGEARELQVLPVCASPLRSGEHVYPAHPVVDAGRLLVSVRGPDVLAAFVVHDDGARLEHERDVPVDGSWPRHLAVVDGWAVTAVQSSGRVTSQRWDGREVGPVAARLDVAHPACVVAG